MGLFSKWSCLSLGGNWVCKCFILLPDTLSIPFRCNMFQSSCLLICTYITYLVMRRRSHWSFCYHLVQDDKSRITQRPSLSYNTTPLVIFPHTTHNTQHDELHHHQLDPSTISSYVNHIFPLQHHTKTRETSIRHIVV